MKVVGSVGVEMHVSERTLHKELLVLIMCIPQKSYREILASTQSVNAGSHWIGFVF